MSRRILSLTFLVLMLLFTGCAKKLFHFVVPFNKVETFKVDLTGEFGLFETITAAEIRQALDIPEDGEVTRIDIESLSLRVRLLAGNQANLINASGYIVDEGKPLFLFENQTVVTAGMDVKYVGLNALLEKGIKKLAKRINDHVQRLNDSNIEIGLAGDSVPAGQRINMEIDLKISATIQYDQCVEVPDFIGGDSCED